MGDKWKATVAAIAVGLVASTAIVVAAVSLGSTGQEVAMPKKVDSVSQPSASGPVAQARASTVAPDEDYQTALRKARLSTRGWKTDFSRHSVPYDEIMSGGPARDGIPPIDDPRFVTPTEAAAWLTDVEPVIALEVGARPRPTRCRS